MTFISFSPLRCRVASLGVRQLLCGMPCDVGVKPAASLRNACGGSSLSSSGTPFGVSVLDRRYRESRIRPHHVSHVVLPSSLRLPPTRNLLCSGGWGSTAPHRHTDENEDHAGKEKCLAAVGTKTKTVRPFGWTWTGRCVVCIYSFLPRFHHGWRAWKTLGRRTRSAAVFSVCGGFYPAPVACYHTRVRYEKQLEQQTEATFSSSFFDVSNATSASSALAEETWVQTLLREEQTRRQQGGRRGDGKESRRERPRPETSITTPPRPPSPPGAAMEAPAGSWDTLRRGSTDRTSSFESTGTTTIPTPAGDLGCHIFSQHRLLYLPNTNGGDRTPHHTLRQQIVEHSNLLEEMQTFLGWPSSMRRANIHPPTTATREDMRGPSLSSSFSPPQFMIVGCKSVPYLRRQLLQSQEEALNAARREMAARSTVVTASSSSSSSSSSSWELASLEELIQKHRHRFLLVHHSLEVLVELSHALQPPSSSPDAVALLQASSSLTDPLSGADFFPFIRFLRCSELLFPLFHLLPPCSLDTVIFPMPVPFWSAQASYRRVLHHDLFVALHPVLRPRRGKQDSRGVLVFTDCPGYAGFILEELEASKFLVPWTRKRIAQKSTGGGGGGIGSSSSLPLSSREPGPSPFARWLPLDPREAVNGAAAVGVEHPTPTSESPSETTKKKEEEDGDVLLLDEVLTKGTAGISAKTLQEKPTTNKTQGEIPLEFPQRRHPYKFPLIALAAAKSGDTPQPTVREWSERYTYARRYYRSLYEE